MSWLVERGRWHDGVGNPGKAELALAVLEAHWESCRGELMEPAFATDLPPLDRIRRLFQLSYEGQVSGADGSGQIKGCLFANFAMELRSQDARVRQKAAKYLQQMAAYFERALDQESPGSDHGAHADAILAYYQGVMLLAKTRNDPSLIRLMAEAATELAQHPHEVIL